MADDKDPQKKATFSSDTKKHDGKTPPAVERQTLMFSTQEDDADEEPAADNTPVIGEHNAGSLFLTQTEDLFTIFNDPERRESIVVPHITVNKVDNDGEETLAPLHFFEEDGSITIGNGLANPGKCDVRLSNQRNGKYMNEFSLSNCAFVASSVTGEEGQQMKIKLDNRFQLAFWSARQKRLRMLAVDEELDIGDGDEIRFSTEAPYSKIKFTIPGWVQPIDPAVVVAQELAIAKINDAEKQCEKAKMELQAHIGLLRGKENEIKKCHTIEEVDAVVTSVSSALPTLSVEAPSELKQTVSNLDPTDQVLSARTMTGTKRKMDDLSSETPIESTIGGLPTQERQKYEIKNFQKKQQDVANAHHVLSNPPKKKTNQWAEKAEKARQVIRTAKQTKCIYFASGFCMHGSSCPFLHQNCEDRSSAQMETSCRERPLHPCQAVIK